MERMQTIQEEISVLKEKKNDETKTDVFRTPQHPAVVLTTEMNFDVWFRMITGELASLKYDDLLLEQKNEAGEINYDPDDQKTKGRLNFVTTFLLARVDDSYKQSICDLELPYEMLKKIRDMRYPNLLSMRMTLERQWNNMIMTDSEDVLKFTNRYNEATKRLIALGVKLDDVKITDNYCIAMKARFPELCRRFDVQNSITFDEMKNLALSIESTEKESKARVDETSSGLANVAEKDEKKHEKSSEKTAVVCFRCGRPNHLASECTNPRKICYNCGKLGSHEQKDCTAPKSYFPTNAKFPSGRIEKSFRGQGNRGSFRGRSRGPRRDGFRGRGRGRGSNRQNAETTYKRVKMTGADGKDKYVMFSMADDRMYELPESNIVEGESVNVSKEKLNSNVVEFIGDSGATEHIVNNRSILSNVTEVKNGVIRSANKSSSANLKVECKGEILSKNNSGGNIKLQNVLCAPQVSRNIISLRKVVNAGIDVNITNQGIRLVDEKNKKVIKEGPYDGRFWYLNFQKSRDSLDSEYCLHSTLGSNSKSINLGQGVTTQVVDSKRQEKIMNVNKLQEEGSKVSFQNCSTVSYQKPVRDESFSADVLEEHDYAKTNLKTNENAGEHNTVLITNDHAYVRSIDQTAENEYHNEFLESFTDKDIDRERASEVYEQATQVNLQDPSPKLNKNKNKGFVWHIRLGHVSKMYLEAAAKFIPELKGVVFDDDLKNCEVCIKAKAVKKPSPTVRFRNIEPLKLIHTDLMGPISPSSFRFGNKYIMTFTDDATRYVWAYPLPDKTAGHIAVSKLLSDIRRIKGASASIHEFRLDNGTEYATDNMKDLLKKEGILLNQVPPYTPDLNGTAERLNLDLQRQIRSLIFDSGFPKDMWAWALRFAVNIRNKTPKKALGGKIPYIEFTERPCTVKYFRRFGCVCHVLKNKTMTKFEERTIEGFLVACNEDSYTMFEVETGKFWKSKNVDFVESKVYGDVFKKTAKKSVLEKEGSEQEDDGFWSEEVERSASRLTDDIKRTEVAWVEFFEDSDELPEVLNLEKEPLSYIDAVSGDEKELWVAAINEEITSLNKNETWSLVKKNEMKSRNVLTSKWVFKKKTNADGALRYKARLVIRGFQDKNNYDRTETYSPVMRLMDFRFLVSIANKYNLCMQQMDVKTAFLHGILEEDIYMYIPDGVKGKENLKSDYVCALKKALYGLKISPKKWYERFKEQIMKQGFNPYPFQSCLFIWRNKESFVVVGLYVDDLLIVGNNPNKIKSLKFNLNKVFDMVDLKEPKIFLGIEIIRNSVKFCFS